MHPNIVAYRGFRARSRRVFEPYQMSLHLLLPNPPGDRPFRPMLFSLGGMMELTLVFVKKTTDYLSGVPAFVVYGQR